MTQVLTFSSPSAGIDAVLVATIPTQVCKQISISHTHLQCHFPPLWVRFGAHPVPEDLLINFGLSGPCPSRQTLKTPCSLLGRGGSSQHISAGTGGKSRHRLQHPTACPFLIRSLELWECSLSLGRWGAAVNVAPEHWGQGEGNKVPEPQSWCSAPPGGGRKSWVAF